MRAERRAVHRGGAAPSAGGLGPGDGTSVQSAAVTHSRRAFLEEASLASLLATFSPPARAAVERLAREKPPLLRPKALARGATVALVSPASPPSDPENVAVAEDIVRSLGFSPRVMPNVAKRTMYLAGSDEERAADLNAAFGDPSVDAVWCVRGGYGSPRILPLVNYELIRQRPKPFIGYSDVTALLNAITRLTGLVTFHGPNANETQTAYALDGFRRVLERPEAAGVIAAPPPFETKEGQVERQHRLKTLAPGKARGRLVGGNVSVLSTLIGTPFEPELEEKVLFLEEVGEEPYRIDRWLTHLVLTGKLSSCAGIVLGKFTDCGPRDFQPSFNGTWTWQEVAADRFGKLGVPVLSGLLFGHVADKATLPLGVLAQLDADAKTLTLLEPAVA